MMTAAYGEVATALRRGGTVALTGLQSLPAAFSNSMQSLHEEQTGMKELSLTAAGAIVAGLATSAVFLMAFARLMPRLRPDRGLVAKVSLAGLRLAGDLLAVVIFVVLARNGAHMGMVSGSFGKEVTSGFIHIAMTTAIFASFGRLLFARINGFEPLFDIADASWHLKMMVGFGFLSGFTHSSLNLADARGLAPMAVDGWLFLNSTIITAYLLVWVIVGRSDIANSHSGMPTDGSVLPAISLPISTSFPQLLYGCSVFWSPERLKTSFGCACRASARSAFILIPILHRRSLWLVFNIWQYHRKTSMVPGFHSVLLWALRIPFTGAIWLIGILAASFEILTANALAACGW
uniref:Uncharacterized protein n=1 Tax=Agrobacterium vitis TaxID=373 RepID=A7XEF2_AGRVI|nr:hypothetical protein [Agrobacterium vitis]